MMSSKDLAERPLRNVKGKVVELRSAFDARRVSGPQSVRQLPPAKQDIRLEEIDSYLPPAA